MEEDIDIEEFGWYETWLVQRHTGIDCVIVLAGQEAYCDQLGPRIRIKNTESSNPQDMVPIFLEDSTNIGLDYKLYVEILQFISINKDKLIRFWIYQNQYEDSYTSESLVKDVVSI